MIFERLNQWRALPGLVQHPIWQTAFIWLEMQAATASEGIHDLGEAGFFARVMSYALKTRDEARYEMHRHTIDIQYTVQGGEGIEVASFESLDPLNDYSEVKDAEHFVTPVHSLARVNNLTGYFSVLFPGEPHMPQLTIPNTANVRKVVVKIPARLVAGQV